MSPIAPPGTDPYLTVHRKVPTYPWNPTWKPPDLPVTHPVPVIGLRPPFSGKRDPVSLQFPPSKDPIAEFGKPDIPQDIVIQPLETLVSPTRVSIPTGLTGDPHQVFPRQTQLSLAIAVARKKLSQQTTELATVKVDFDRSRDAWQKEMEMAQNMSAMEKSKAELVATAKLERAVAEIRSELQPQITGLTERHVKEVEKNMDKFKRAEAEFALAHVRELDILKSTIHRTQQEAINEGRQAVDAIRERMERERISVVSGKVKTEADLATLRAELTAARDRLEDQKGQARDMLSGSEKRNADAAKFQADQARTRLDTVTKERDESNARVREAIEKAKDQVRVARQERLRPTQDAGSAKAANRKLAEATAQVAELSRALGKAEGGMVGLASQLAQQKNISKDQVQQLQAMGARLDQARADAMSAQTQGGSAAQTAIAVERRLSQQVDQLASKLGISQGDIQRLKTEVATQPLQSAAKIAGLQATTDQLHARVQDLKMQIASGDRGKAMELDGVEKDLARSRDALKDQYDQGRTAGISEGQRREGQKAQATADAARHSADLRFSALQNELKRAQQLMASGKQADVSKLSSVMQSNSDALAAERRKLTDAAQAHQAEIARLRQQSTEALTSERRASSKKLMEAERQKATELSGAQEGVEQMLTAESLGHQKDLEAQRGLLRTTEGQLSELRAESAKLMGEEKLRSKERLSEAEKQKQREITELRKHIADAELRATSAQGDVRKSKTALEFAVTARKAAEKQQATSAGLATTRQTEVTRVQGMLQEREKTLAAEHANKIAHLNTAADASKNQAIQDAVAREQGALIKIRDAHQQAIAGKDAQIQRHQAAHQRVNQALKDSQQAHDAQMNAMRTNLASHLQTFSAKLVEVQRLESETQARGVEIQRLVIAGHIDQDLGAQALLRSQEDTAQWQSHALEIQTQAQHMDAMYQQKSSQVAQQAAVSHAALVAQGQEQSHREHQAYTEKIQLMEKQHAEEAALAEKTRMNRDSFQDAVLTMTTDPEFQILEYMRDQAKDTPDDEVVQDKLKQMEGLWTQHQAKATVPTVADMAAQIVPAGPDPMGKPDAPATPPAPGTEGIEQPDPLEPDLPTEADPTPIPGLSVPSPLEATLEQKEPEPVPVRRDVRSLEERIGATEYGQYQDRVAASLSQVAKGLYVEARRPAETEAFAKFQENPGLDARAIGANPETVHKIQRMQGGLQEANIRNRNREKELFGLSPEDKVAELAEDRLEEMYMLYKTKQRRELMEQYRGQGTIQSTAEVDAEIAADEVRPGAILRGLNEQIAQNTVGHSTDPLWGDNPKDIDIARARNTDYLKMEIKKVRSEIAPVQISLPMREQIIAEREQIILKAARLDRIAARKKARPKPQMSQRASKRTKREEETAEEAVPAPAMTQAPPRVSRSKEVPGRNVTEVLKQHKEFVKAVEYVATPWWKAKANKQFASRQKNATAAIKLRKTAGSTIARQIEEHRNRVLQNQGSMLKRKSLSNYSLAKHSAAEVTEFIRNKPLAQVKPADLKLIRIEYQAITKDATPAEKATPEYKAADRLEDILTQVISEIEDYQTLAGSRVPHRIVDKAPETIFRAPAVPQAAQASVGRKRSASMARDTPEVFIKPQKFTQDAPETPIRGVEKAAPGVSMHEALDLLTAETGRGLSKKPRKRVKPRKTKQKTPKKRGRTPKKQVSRPKTGLQKWHSQRNAPRRMRL